MAGLTGNALTNRSVSSLKSITPNPAPLGRPPGPLARCGGIPGPWAARFGGGGSRLIFSLWLFDKHRSPNSPSRGLPGPSRASGARRRLQLFWALPGTFFRNLTGLPGASQGLQGLPRTFQDCQNRACKANVVSGSPFEGPAKSFSRASQDPGLHLLSPVRAFQSKIHKFREPRGLTNFGGTLPCLPATMMQHATCVLRLSAYIVHNSKTTHTTLQSREASTSAACGSTLPMRPCKPKNSV